MSEAASDLHVCRNRRLKIIFFHILAEITSSTSALATGVNVEGCNIIKLLILLHCRDLTIIYKGPFQKVWIPTPALIEKRFRNVILLNPNRYVRSAGYHGRRELTVDLQRHHQGLD